jgi:hypothetical protein
MKTNNSNDDNSDIKCSSVRANGLSTKAIEWLYDNSGIFVLELIGRSYKIVKNAITQMQSEYPNEMFEVEFTNGEVIKSENFPQSKKSIYAPCVFNDEK